MIKPVNLFSIQKTKNIQQNKQVNNNEFNFGKSNNSTTLLSAEFYSDKIPSINKVKNEQNNRIKNLTLLLIDRDVSNALLKQNLENQKLKYLFNELKDDETRTQVFGTLIGALESVKKSSDYKSDNEFKSDIDALLTYTKTSVRSFEKTYNKDKYKMAAFKGEVLDTTKEIVGDVLPLYSTVSIARKIAKGDAKAIAKSTVAVIDNTAFQPVKQATAGAIAAKAATIGSMFGPPGAFIGGAIGYIGTIIFWGKTRNAVVGAIYDEAAKPSSVPQMHYNYAVNEN